MPWIATCEPVAVGVAEVMRGSAAWPVAASMASARSAARGSRDVRQCIHGKIPGTKADAHGERPRRQARARVIDEIAGTI